LLKATVERGVQLTIFTRPERAQSRESWRERLRELRATVPRVVAYRNMHQKIVVIDREIALLGSLNPLSHRNTREVMVEHEHADYFANPPQCGSCKTTAELRRRELDETGPPWSWCCAAKPCGWTQDATPPEPRDLPA